MPGCASGISAKAPPPETFQFSERYSPLADKRFVSHAYSSVSLTYVVGHFDVIVRHFLLGRIPVDMPVLGRADEATAHVDRRGSLRRRRRTAAVPTRA